MSDTLVQHDRIDPERALALAHLLDRDDVPTAGDPLPLLWNLVYFLPRPRQDALGPDGHPLVGFPTPPAPGMRRMFAGGRLRVLAQLPVGSDAVATTEVVDATRKEGRSGPLELRTTRTTITVDGTPVVEDERDIVYLEAAPGGAGAARTPDPLPPMPHRRTVTVDETLLFRFSALTYNAHRIHYDRAYTQDVEGHPGLVVHGPLQALLMAELATSLRPTATGTLTYRLTAPLHEGRGLHVDAEEADDSVILRIADDAGAVTARATWA